ncbi:class I SAM-dependent methyltransferase [Salimicrobium sp. PL1-032A]|uniref:class I SAM-dependent methyltransferase n=1 Tax=Salimicrobium sp. PL1-032A TaxID=3095364 RepID=UPI003261AD7B
MDRKKWHEQAEEKWDDFSEDWRGRSKQMWKDGSRKKVLPFLQSFLGTGAEVLDLGCGDGQGSEMLQEEGYRVTGVDLSSKMIDIAAGRSTEATFLQADVTALPFEEESFDGVMAINCLEWVASPLEAIREIHRVAKPGAIFVAGILGPVAGPRTNSYARLEGEEVVCNTMMPWEFRRLAERHGFKTTGMASVPKEGAPDKVEHPLMEQAVSFMTLFALEKQNVDAPGQE